MESHQTELNQSKNYLREKLKSLEPRYNEMNQDCDSNYGNHINGLFKSLNDRINKSNSIETINEFKPLINLLEVYTNIWKNLANKAILKNPKSLGNEASAIQSEIMNTYIVRIINDTLKNTLITPNTARTFLTKTQNTLELFEDINIFKIEPIKKVRKDLAKEIQKISSVKANETSPPKERDIKIVNHKTSHMEKLPPIKLDKSPVPEVKSKVGLSKKNVTKDISQKFDPQKFFSKSSEMVKKMEADERTHLLGLLKILGQSPDNLQKVIIAKAATFLEEKNRFSHEVKKIEEEKNGSNFKVTLVSTTDFNMTTSEPTEKVESYSKQQMLQFAREQVEKEVQVQQEKNKNSSSEELKRSR